MEPISHRSRVYKRPRHVVVVVGVPDESIVKELNTYLASHGREGLKLIIATREPSSRVLEALRDFLLSNIAFTIEVYSVSYERLREIIGGEGGLVKIFASSGVCGELPEDLAAKVCGR